MVLGYFLSRLAHRQTNRQTDKCCLCQLCLRRMTWLVITQHVTTSKMHSGNSLSSVAYVTEGRVYKGYIALLPLTSYQAKWLLLSVNPEIHNQSEISIQKGMWCNYFCYGVWLFDGTHHTPRLAHAHPHCLCLILNDYETVMDELIILEEFYPFRLGYLQRYIARLKARPMQNESLPRLNHSSLIFRCCSPWPYVLSYNRNEISLEQ